MRLPVIAALLVLAAAIARPALAAPEPVRLTAQDGVTVFGAFYPSTRHRALILLFHQAGSSKDEYATIAPRLAALSYDALAIDQRSGGAMFGPNETATEVGGSPSYVDAERDLEAAFRWGLARHEPLILWGSSYSAALVFRLAAAHPGEIAAVLAFSPGEYLYTPPSVAASANHVTAPVFVTSASTPDEIAAARQILAATHAAIKVQYVPQIGIHGSSTLIPERDPAGAAPNWAAVSSFLLRVAP